MKKLHHKLADLFGYDLIRKKKSHHTFDLHLQKIIENNLITTIIDVGANKGQFALRLRQLGYRGKIISFEPVYSAYLQVRELAEKDSAWEVHNYAIGNIEGTLELNVTVDSTDLSSFLQPNAFSQVYYKQKVASIETQQAEVHLLKNFIKDLTNESVLLKTDTQGFDLEVLKGAEHYLAELIKVVVIELSFKPIYENMTTGLEMMHFLKEHHFNPSGLFTVSRDKKTYELIEMDGIFLNQRYIQT